MFIKAVFILWVIIQNVSVLIWTIRTSAELNVSCKTQKKVSDVLLF